MPALDQGSAVWSAWLESRRPEWASMRGLTFRGASVEGAAMQSFLILGRQVEGCTKTWLGWKRKSTTPVAWWAPKTRVTFVTWREALRRDPELEQAVCEQHKVKVLVVVGKIG